MFSFMNTASPFIRLPKKSDFDFLWTTKSTYLYTSLYLDAGYTDRNFVACLNGTTHTLYVHKKEREKLSKVGLQLYTTNFAEYTNELKSSIFYFDQKIKEIHDITRSFKRLINKDFKEAWNNIIDIFIQLQNVYFHTEYHSTDFIELRHLKNITSIGKLKLSLRTLINTYYYEPSILTAFIQETHRRFDVPSPLWNYHYREIIESLTRGRFNKCPEYRNSLTVRGEFSHWSDIYGSLAEAICDELNAPTSDTQTLYGAVAYKGIAVSTAKVIPYDFNIDIIKEIKSMKKGQILVAGSTGPELIFAFKKAAAIVTDEGGILSHAAIISREMKIPTVIGTRWATKIIKTGDKVRVDAHNGVITIL